MLPVLLATDPAWANGGGQPPVDDNASARIALAKSAAEARSVGDGTFFTTIQLRVQNVGDEVLRDVQLYDDIQALLAPAEVRSIRNLSVTGGLGVVNTHFDGVFDTLLLPGNEYLQVGAEAVVSFDLIFDPNGEAGPFFNSAKAIARGDVKTTVDKSQNGDDPDPDTAGNRPADNPEPGDDAELTPIVLPPLTTPSLGLAKRLTRLEQLTPGRFSATFELLIENLSTAIIKRVQITDALDAAFLGASEVRVSTRPLATGVTANPAFDGVSDNRLLSGDDVLAAGSSARITFTVQFTPDGVYEFFNSALASGVAGETTLNDRSDDGSVVDSNGNGVASDPGEDDPTPVVVPIPARAQLGLAKALRAASANADGSYDLTFRFRVENSGTVLLSNLQVADDLDTTFPAPASYSLTSLTSPTLSVNSAYNGSSVSNLLLGSDNLAAGESAELSVQLRLFNAPGQRFENSATAAARDPDGMAVRDVSTDGDVADANGDGDPANDSVPTPIELPVLPVNLGVAKTATAAVATGDGAFVSDVTVAVENLGALELDSLAVVENLAATLDGAALVAVSGLVADGPLVINPAFDGVDDTNLLDPASRLAAGARAEIRFRFEFRPQTVSGQLRNQVLARATDPFGRDVEDLSTDGSDPDPDGDGVPEENTPTLIPFRANAVLGLAKAAGPIEPRADNLFAVTLRFVVENPGDSVINDLVLSDDLQATFGATAFVIDGVPVASAGFAINPGFDGVADTVLARGASLPANGRAEISLPLLFGPVVASSEFFNSATIGGTSLGVALTDVSTDGDLVDPNADGIPDEAVPTPLRVDVAPAAPVVGVAKSAQRIAPTPAGHRVELLFTLANLGDTPAPNVQLEDNLRATFGAAATISLAEPPSLSGSLTLVNPGYDGVNDTALLAGSETLTAGAQAELLLTVEVSGVSGDFFNSARISTRDDTGLELAADLSDDGTVVDANGNGQPDDPDEDDPTPITLRADTDGILGLSKAATPAAANGDGTFTTEFSLTLANLGGRNLTSVSVQDNLSETFAGTTLIAVGTPTAEGGLVANPDFDGVDDINLLLPASMLTAGSRAGLGFSVTFRPGLTTGALFNSALAQAEDGDGGQVTDESTNGDEPDPDGDGNPQENTPTPVEFTPVPLIGLAKAAAAPTPLEGGGFRSILTFTVANLGNVDLELVQVEDNLQTVFDETPFSVGAVSASGSLVANPAFDGSTNSALLDAAQSSLATGATATISVTVNFTPAVNPARYLNLATAVAEGPGGTVSDTSTDGLNPDPDGNGSPDEAEPTPIDTAGFTPAAIGIAKALLESNAESASSFRLLFEFVLENLSSDTDATFVQVTDDLAAAFPDGQVSVVELTVVDGSLTLNDGFDGVADTRLLAGTDTLAAAGRAVLRLEARVIVPGNGGSYLNQARLTSAATLDGPPQSSDLSDDGDTPDPDGNGSASDSGEDDPTPVVLSANPRLGVAKAVTETRLLGVNRYAVTFLVTVENLGDVRIDNVGVEENLSTAFPAPVALSVVTPPLLSGALTLANGAFDGVTETNLLAAGNSLAPGDVGTITFSVELDLNGATGPFANQVFVSGDNPGGDPVDDPSGPGSEPDPDGDGNPGGPGEDEPTPVELPAGLIGTVYADLDNNLELGADEPRLSGWTVELLDADGEVVATVVTADDGAYQFLDRPAGSVNVRFRHPETNVTWGARPGELITNTVTVVDFPVAPSGRFYSAVERSLVPGVTVMLVDIGGARLPDECLLPGQQEQTVGSDAAYRFDLQPGAAAGCPDARSDYQLLVSTVPEPFVAGVSTLIAPEGTLDVSVCAVDTNAAPPCVVQPQDSAPMGMQSTAYYLNWQVGAGDQAVVHNHIPLDLPAAGAPLNLVSVSKTAGQPTAVIGDLIVYDVTVTNLSANVLADVTLVDDLPGGFQWVADSQTLLRAGADGEIGTLDDLQETLASSGVDPVTLGPFVLAGNESARLRYYARVSAGVTRGEYVNVVTPIQNDTQIGNRARATVEIVADPIFEQTTILGKVFHDRNRDGWQDENEPGIGGVRLATVGGLLIETDGAGRYHIADVDVERFERGRNFILKLDAATLPDGAEVISENPRVIRITQGLMSRINFAVVLPDVEPPSPAQPPTTYLRTQTTRLRGVVQPVWFESGKSNIPDTFVARLNDALRHFSERDNLRLRFVGHTDNEPLSPRAARIYGDNQGLSEARALQVKNHVMAELERMRAAEGQAGTINYETSGYAYSQPIASNANREGMALNRRVEIEILYDEEVNATEIVTSDEVAVGEFADYATDETAFTAYFAEGATNMSADQQRVLAASLLTLQDTRLVALEVTGHTDRVSDRKQVPADDHAIGLARAATVADQLADMLKIPREQISIKSAGAAEPADTNDTDYGRRLNRRAEIRVRYEYLATTTRVERAPVQQALPVAPTVLAAGGRLWLTEDPLVVEPRLDVLADTHAVVNRRGSLTDPLTFTAYSNYSAFVARYQLDVYDASDTDLVTPLASWTGARLEDIAIEQFAAPLKAEQRLIYVLRAFDDQGRTDATHERMLRVVRDEDTNVVREEPGRVWGQTNLARQTIPVRGSRIRVQGEALAGVDAVIINERTVPVDERGRFAAEFQVAQGNQAFDVRGTQRGATIWQQALSAEVDDSYTFFVALANLTAGQNDLSGDFEPLAGDDHFDESVFVDGRLAFYAKAKIKGKYLLTAQMDSTEDELRDFGDNLRREDPRRIFRQLDPNRYYAVYGDDSTTVSDVDSQGAFYLRLDWDRNQVLWGNFNTGMTDTEFTQYNRSLYGARVSHASQTATAHGDSRTSATVFASEAQSAAAHVSFRATGGSLYYLKHTDIVQGSEKVWVEVRQRDTEQVVERQEFIAGRDYEIDALQGRIILNRPLSQVVNDRAGSIIRTDVLHGDDVYLLVDYEYVPAGFAAEDLAYGGRAKAWLGDHVGVGISKVVDERDGADFDLEGVDVTFKAGQGTYLTVEAARSEARQNNANFASADGGLSFSSNNDATPGDALDGEAFGVEARVNLRDFDPALSGDARAWHKNRDAEFSSGRLRQGGEVTDQGIEAIWQPGDGVRLAAGYTDLEEETVHHTRVARVQADVRVDRLTLGAEMRHEDISRDSLAPALRQDGEALLAGVRLGYALNEQQTLYAAAQTGLDEEGDYSDTDLVTMGVNTQVNPHAAVSIEAVDGDRGSALMGGLDFSPADRLDFNVKGGVGSGALNQFSGSYQLAEGHELYGSYAVDPDRTDGARNLLTIGQRRDMGNRLGVFTESQFGKDDRFGGVNHAFGLDYDTDSDWVLSSLLQYSENDTDANPFERLAASLGATLKRDRLKFASKLEYRADEGPLLDTRQYLLSTSATYRYSDHRRWLGQLNLSWTDDELASAKDAKFVELDLGHAYRPTGDDRWNVLTKYSYLFDLVSTGQDALRPDQAVHIVSAEALYRLNARWELGGKLALKEGRLRAGRDRGRWEDYGVGLGVVRARYHLTRRWDGLAEYRYLHDRHGDSTRHGALLGAYRHLGEHMKLGVGYNFTDFSDDLKDAGYDNHGWFVDLIGKW